MNKKVFLSIYLFIFVNYLQLIDCGFGGSVNNEELYKLLGVSKTATTKQIRVAFKKLALEKHPDKNQDDPNANEVFIKINRAYEILKDDELRKKYDTYGEEGLKDDQNKGYNYQSWNFYKQNFGIYDDDPEIVTLSRSDFMQYVDGNQDTIWFINFYSTQCSHCHELAPTWRELSKQLDGVVRIGAVNCMDDWMLCNEQQIQSFPSLIMYPKRERFNEVKTTENLLKFALSFASGNVYDLTSFDTYLKRLNKKENKPWLISYCLPNSHDDDLNNLDESESESEINYELNCLDDLVQRKIAIMLHGLVRVANLNCVKKETQQKICSILKPKISNPVIFYSKLPNITSSDLDVEIVESIKSADYKRVVEQVLKLIPDVESMQLNKFEEILEKLRDKSKSERPWLIQFVSNYQSNQDLELRKLPSLLSPNYNFGRIECDKIESSICNRYQIIKYPTYILFKSASYMSGNVVMKENWYEISYSSRQSPQDLVAFVKDNANTPVRTLTSFNVNSLPSQLAEENKQGFFVDFFAPWCPPCMNLLPEFRKASKLDSARSVSFGTIDCTTNTALCEQYNVRSYPTTILYNNTVPHIYHGHHSAADINDFIQDILKPTVIILDYSSFQKLVSKKPVGKIWLIDFYASWCGPCQQLAPEWRKLAKLVDKNLISIGQVDCVVEQSLCAEQGVQSYPNIRVYPTNNFGSSYFEQYQGWMRDAHSLLQWVQNYLPSKTHMLNMNNFEEKVLKNKKVDDNSEPWIVDFYAPWCGHCQVFAPTFESLAAKFEGRVKFGKVNCDQQQYLCQVSAIRAYPTIKFYPFSTSNYVNWQSGEEIQAYDFNALVNIINSKLESYGYNKKSKKDDTEL